VRLIAEDGELDLAAGFLTTDERAVLGARLLRELAWQSEEILLFGRHVAVPRLVCWYGDPGATYRYSGVSHQPSPWHEVLADLRTRIEAFSGHVFNAVLCNRYRSGRDSMGWHADDEPELGERPFIASLSLGAERLFRIRHRGTGRTLDVPLRDGDLLLMGGELQSHWRHCVPRTARPCGERINLTFRRIVPRS
jgi:alkylated DNA repair dioxygenase AlkB